MTLYECLKQGFETGDYKKAKEDWMNQNMPARIGEFRFSQELSLIDSYLMTKIKIDETLFGPWLYFFKKSLNELDLDLSKQCLDVYLEKWALKAVKENDEESIVRFLNTKTKSSRSVKLEMLSLEAARVGNIELLDKFLDKGAKLNASFFENQLETPLMQASINGQREVVKHLLKKGAQAYLKGSVNKQIFEDYRKKNDVDKMADFLIKYGKFLKEKKVEARVQIEDELILLMKEGKVSQALKLLKKNPYLDLNAFDLKGKTAFSRHMRAVSEAICLIKYGKFLKEKKVEARVQIEDELILLMKEGKVSQALELLKKNPYFDLNAFDLKGTTALSRHMRVVSEAIAVLDLGGDITKKDADGENPIDLVFSLDLDNFVKELKDRGLLDQVRASLKKPILHMAFEKKANTIAHFLIENKIGIEEKDEKGRTPLMKSIYLDWPLKFKKLIEVGVDLEEVDQNGETAIFYALKKKNYFDTLVEKVNLDHQNYTTGDTVLIKAIQDGMKNQVQSLLSSGADVFIKNNQGVDAYNRAMQEGQIEIAGLVKNEVRKKLGLYPKEKPVNLPKKKIPQWPWTSSYQHQNGC